MGRLLFLNFKNKKERKLNKIKKNMESSKNEIVTNFLALKKEHDDNMFYQLLDALMFQNNIIIEQVIDYIEKISPTKSPDVKAHLDSICTVLKSIYYYNSYTVQSLECLPDKENPIAKRKKFFGK